MQILVHRTEHLGGQLESQEAHQDAVLAQGLASLHNKVRRDGLLSGLLDQGRVG